MGGRPRKSPEEHAQNGNPSKLNLDDTAPKPPPGVGDPPGWIVKRARVVWVEWAQVLERSKFLAETDAAVFGMFCVSFAKYQEAVLVDDEAGIKSWRKDAEASLRLMGLSPTERSKVMASQGADDLNPYSVYSKTTRGRPTREEEAAKKARKDGA